MQICQPKSWRPGFAAAAALVLTLTTPACDYLVMPPELALKGSPGSGGDPKEPPVKTTPTPKVGAGTPTPQPQATPTPIPKPGQWIRGTAMVHVSGINRLPMGHPDYIIIATFTWELSGADKGVPIAELSLRGTSNHPCLSKPCGDNAGLVVRATANAQWDGTHSSGVHCGSGTLYPVRLALGPLGPDGGIDVRMNWDESGLHVATPVDSVFIPTEVPSSYGYGRALVGAPFVHGERGYGWDQLSINKLGGNAQIMEFSGTPGTRHACP